MIFLKMMYLYRFFNVFLRDGQETIRIPCKYNGFCITTDAATLGVCGAFDRPFAVL